MTGLTLHQMGFSRGDDLSRYDRVTAHFVITPAGNLAQLHPIERRLNASSALNATTMSVEFAGNLRSDRGRWHKVARFGADTLTSRQVSAGRFLLRHLRDTHGFTHVFAHSQGAAGRKANCCGPEVWASVGEFAIRPEGLGMSDGGAGFRKGRGRPIPEGWRIALLA